MNSNNRVKQTGHIAEDWDAPNPPTNDNRRGMEDKMAELTPTCFKCGATLDTYSKCTCCYDELGAKLTEARAEVTTLKESLARLRKALKSIADNTCCDKCQEAARVAQQALEASDG